MGWGKLNKGGEKVYTLAYADDLAEEEGGMRVMMSRLEGYMRGKRLEVNARKSKIMRFGKGGGRKKKIRWSWEGREAEEISSFKYLGYVFQRNGKQDEHVKDRMKKGMMMLGNREEEVWRKLGKEVMVVRRTGMDGVGIWGKDLGVEGKGEIGKVAGKVPEMGVGSEVEDARIYDQGGVAEGQTEE